MTHNSSLRIVIAQLNFLVGDTEANVQRVIDAATKARDEMHADLIVFPELTITGYPPEDLLLRKGFRDHAKQCLELIAQQVQGIGLIIGHPYDEADGVYNAASLICDGAIIATYFKQHLPNYSVFDEKRYFLADNRACVVDVKGVPVGITICEDIWFAESAQLAAEAGAKIIININASPYHRHKRPEREEVVRHRAQETGLPVVYANLVGGQDELVFDGESFVVNAQGETVMRATAFEEALVPVDFDFDGKQLKPADGQQVSELLSELASVYQALVLGVRDYIEKNHFKGVVIGLSGGIDSALTLAIAVDAIGPERVEAVSMPSRYTAEMSNEDAAAEAEALGVVYHTIPIENVYEAFLDSLREEFAGTEVDTTEENIQARCRGVLLMAISNKKRKIVLTTGNKSEMSVGYATLYGDMAGGFGALKDVPKTLVYQLAEYRNSISAVIPQRVIERPPSAELAPDQKDEDSLPPYDVLDPILEHYVEQDKSLEEIIALGYDEATVRRVATMVDRNEYKRRQAAPGVRITKRAFGRDRRYPITSGYGYTSRIKQKQEGGE